MLRRGAFLASAGAMRIPRPPNFLSDPLRDDRRGAGYFAAFGRARFVFRFDWVRA
jgi:hypothetical protein